MYRITDPLVSKLTKQVLKRKIKFKRQLQLCKKNIIKNMITMTQTHNGKTDSIIFTNNATIQIQIKSDIYKLSVHPQGLMYIILGSTLS